MAKGKFTGGKLFGPGNKASSGRPRLAQDLVESRQMNRAEFMRIGNELINKTPEELSAIAKDTKNVPIIVGTVAQILLKSFTAGDPQRFNFILDRLIGSVKVQLDVSAVPQNDEQPANYEALKAIMREKALLEVQKNKQETDTIEISSYNVINGA